MKKRIFLLSLSGVALSVLVLAGVFYYSQKLHNTYGFLSRTSPIAYKATIDGSLLILDFPPGERGLGIIELNIARQNSTRSGTVSATMRELGRMRMLSEVAFTTTHVDSSRPLLIPFRSFAELSSNEYRLTIQTDPSDLLPEYLVQQGLQARGVYFIDRIELKNNLGEIMRLYDWKIADLQEVFTAIPLYLLFLTPLFLPFVLYLLWYQYKNRHLSELFAKRIIYYLLKPLVWSGQFSARHLESSAQSRLLMFKHYKKLLVFLIHACFAYLSDIYVANKKLVWDTILVFVWVLTNIIFVMSEKTIDDPQYIAFIISYVIFAVLRRSDPRTHYIGALLTLLFCPYYLSLGLEIQAEKAAIFVYGFMIVGAFFDAIELYRSKKNNA